MNLRRFKIGTRLALGFGFCLFSAALLLVVALVNQRIGDRHQLQGSEQQELLLKGTSELRSALLQSAIAVRNMGLETELPEVYKHQAAAQAQRKTYLRLLAELRQRVGPGAEQGLLDELVRLDGESEKHVAEAVGLLGAFSTEQAVTVIKSQVGPLLARSQNQLARLDEATVAKTATALDGARRRSGQALQLVLGGAAVLLACVFALAWRVTASIVQPLKGALHATDEVARGNLDFAIGTEGDDEAASVMRGLDSMRVSLARMVGEVRGTAQMVATASSEIAHGNADLSTRTETQAGALQVMASTMSQLDATVRQTADNASQASVRAERASGLASRGGSVVAQVVETMREINASSTQISDIIGVIDGIAFQTNILALNAAVEAARAGEQGRGFAVVAAEVRSLAQRSAEAARQIKGLISTSVERVERGSSLVQVAGQSMTDIMEAIRQVNDISVEISAATREQSSGVSDVVRSVSGMDHATQQNAALVEQSAAAADGLKTHADRLASSMSVFRLGGATARG